MALTTQQVQTFYIAYLARAGESAGVNAWSAPTFNITEAEAAAAFFNSPEATALYPTARTDVAAYVDAVYNNLFGRAAEPAGKAAWVNYINSGAITIEQVPYVIATGAANEDLQALNGKITVATQYTNQVGANYNTDAARAMLKKITSTDPASYTPEALAADLAEALNNVSPGPTPGGTFMLTEGVDYADASKSTHDDVADTFKFTDASEKITATFAQLSKGDQLIDLSNADNDTLDLSLDINNVKQTIGSKNGATLVNIEELDITSIGAKNITFDNTISAAGLKTIKIAGSFLNEKGNDGNGFTFNGNVLKTLTTIDASAITAGNVNIDASKATQDLTITGPNFAASINGGSGNDTITGQGTIDGGPGADVITAHAVATINGGSGDNVITANAAATINGGDDVDTIYLKAGGSVNGGSGDDKIYVSGSANATINGDSGADIIDASDATGNVTITGGSGADVISLGAGANVVKYSSAGETAKISSATGDSSAIIKAVKGAASSADTINNVKVGDKIDISAVAGTGAVLGSGGAVIQSSSISSALSSSVDVLLIKDNADYFLVYEASGSGGTTTSLGSGAEVIKLVGLTADNEITLENGIVTIV